MKQKNNPENVLALYSRVSSEQQVKNGESLDVQLSLANRYLKKKGKEFSLLEYREEGISASKVHFTKRPKLMELLEDAKKGLFRTLLVFRRDRLDRSNDFHTIKYILIKNKVKIVYLDPSEINIEDDAIYGHLIESVITSIAAIEPKLISARVKAVFRDKTLEGLWTTGKPPYGLYHDKENSIITPIPQEEEVVKRIFNHYVNDKLGYRKIAMILNEENIPFRNHLNVEKKWTSVNIRYIISNPIYKGYLRLHKDDGQIKLVPCKGIDTPIIPPEIFNQAEQLKMTRQNFTVSPREITTTFLLSNIFYCACGSKMRGIDNSYYYTNKNGEKIYKKYLYYGCALYNLGNHVGTCQVKRVNADLVHNIVIDQCCNIFQPKNYEKTKEKLTQKQDQALKETKYRIKEVSRKISEIKRKIEVIFENLESTTEAHIVANYESRLITRNEELETHQANLKSLKEYYGELKDKVWTIEDISKKLNNWGRDIHDVSSEVKRRMLLDVIKSVRLNEDGELSIKLKLSLENFDEIKKEEGAHNNSYVHLLPFIYNER